MKITPEFDFLAVGDTKELTAEMTPSVGGTFNWTTPIYPIDSGVRFVVGEQLQTTATGQTVTIKGVSSSPNGLNSSSVSVSYTSSGDDFGRTVQDSDSESFTVVEVDLDIDGVTDANEDDPGGFVFKGELIEITLSLAPSLNTGEVKLEATSGSNKIKVWKEETKQNQVTLSKTWTLSSESIDTPLYVEGINAGEAELKLSFINDSVSIHEDTGKITVKEIREYAISGHGRGDENTFDDYAGHWTYWFDSSTGDEIISDLESVCSGYIILSGVVVFSHGDYNGVLVTKNKELLYPYSGDRDPEAASLNDLAAEINSGDIVFTNNPVSKFQGCNIGDPEFAEEFSEITGGIAYGAGGACFAELDGDEATGWFFSELGPWRKWDNGSEIQNPHLTDNDLTTPSNGTNKLNFW